jgi:2-amino-4-hydroxy-6-hydroxymethyldihydropteridine diphosphokinase
MPQVFVGIGSNIDKEHNVRRGVRELAARYSPLTLSPVYQSRAIGFEGEDFLNLVAAFDTGDSLREIRAALDAIEQACGRIRNGVRFSARTLDLDVLLYGDLLELGAPQPLPAPEIADYPCVLRPLADLAPDRRHPQTGRTFSEMWQDLAVRGHDLRRVNLDLTTPAH